VHFAEFDVHAGTGEVGEVGDGRLAGRRGERCERVLLRVLVQDGDGEVGGRDPSAVSQTVHPKNVNLGSSRARGACVVR
jgi:hypothetical protein